MSEKLYEFERLVTIRFTIRERFLGENEKDARDAANMSTISAGEAVLKSSESEIVSHVISEKKGRRVAHTPWR